jgi:hypothetical protein
VLDKLQGTVTKIFLFAVDVTGTDGQPVLRPTNPQTVRIEDI